MVPVQRERVVPAVPSRPAEDRAVDRTLLRRRARPAQGRPASGRGAQAVQAVGRQVVVVGGGAAAPGPVPAADIRKAARGFSRRRAHARVPGDDLPSDPRRWVEARPVGALPAARAPAQAQARRQEDAPFPDTRTHSDPRTALRSRGSRRLRPLGGRQRHRDGLPSARRGRAQDPVVFSQVGVSVFVGYFFRFWARACRPGVFIGFGVCRT